MSTFIIKKENHKCMDDCKREGCPGHTLELHHQTCADTVIMYKDGTPVVSLDLSEFESFIEMAMEIGPIADIINDYSHKDYL